MAVVTKYGPSYPRPQSNYIPAAALAEGRVKMLALQMDVANGDSAASVFYLGRLPSSAILWPHLSNLRTPAITGLSDVDLGVAGLPELLASGLTLASASTALNPLAAIATADVGKPLWKLMGLSVDPGKMIDVFATLNAGAGAAGLVNGAIGYSDY